MVQSELNKLAGGMQGGINSAQPAQPVQPQQPAQEQPPQQPQI